MEGFVTKSRCHLEANQMVFLSFSIPILIGYVGSGPMGSVSTMTGGGAHPQLTSGLNGPASALTQMTPLTRTYAALTMSFPRGSVGATGPQLNGVSLTANKRHQDSYKGNTADITTENNSNGDELSSKLRQMRTQIANSKEELKRSNVHKKLKRRAHNSHTSKRHFNNKLHTRSKEQQKGHAPFIEGDDVTECKLCSCISSMEKK